MNNSKLAALASSVAALSLGAAVHADQERHSLCPFKDQTRFAKKLDRPRIDAW